MDIIPIVLTVILAIIFIIFLTSFICFMMTFYSPKRKLPKNGEIIIPGVEIYEAHRPRLEEWVMLYRNTPHKKIEIRSFDGLTLRGRYYEKKKGAPIELMLHGYKGSAERDMSGGLARAFAVDHNALIVDHRAGGESDGHVISFGINESRDALAWIDYILKEIDGYAKIIIAGISMGASTALMMSGMDLPENIVAILADCGFTSAKEVIKKVIGEMKLPADILYPFARLGARIFGRFDLEETTPIEAVKVSKIPTIFLHGDSDTLVPCHMSEASYNACTAPKKLVVIKGAGHGLAYPVNEELYVKEVKEFFDRYAG